MPTSGTTVSSNIQVTPREVDFVTRFERNWEAFREILGITRPIKKTPGQILKAKKAQVVLANGDIAEGETIPLSEASVIQIPIKELTLEKYKKAVTAEAIVEHGYDAAVQMTDDEFLAQLQMGIIDEFYKYLLTGTLRSTAGNFKAALAKATGSVRNKWKAMHRTITKVVAFVNINDLYAYLADSSIGPEVATEFGLNYIKNWLGYSTIFLCSDDEIPRGLVVATPVENIALYYLDAGHSDLTRAGLHFVTTGVLNLIGFKTNGNYDKDVSENNALLGMTLFSEYLDGIAVEFISNPDMTDATVAAGTSESYWGTSKSDIQENIVVSGNKITGTLKKLTSGSLVDTWGEGYFIALSFDNFTTGLTYADVKVGMMPSEGSGLLYLDSDKEAVLKVTDKDNQVVVVIQEDGEYQRSQWFDLSDLTLA